ncbi:hypothetical protein CDAR_423631 [Caerostris darwini]|uniref:Uncharacterized protein n=1 Tax=Caerostris darwini TaxID=1538125 RepID=A0AAV4VAF1_9ARAC|nr:hypothetical protein CDAR_423631 [Caerostris darwini]
MNNYGCHITRLTPRNSMECLKRLSLSNKISAIHSGAETVISPTDVLAKAAGRASIHTDSTADKELPLINMGSYPLRLLSLPSSFYCDAQRVENGRQWTKFSKSFPNSFQRRMLISPSEKFHGVVETVSGTSRRKENSCCSGVLPPEPKICKCRRSSMKGGVRMSPLMSPQLRLKECQTGRKLEFRRPKDTMEAVKRDALQISRGHRFRLVPLNLAFGLNAIIWKILVIWSFGSGHLEDLGTEYLVKACDLFILTYAEGI